MRFKRLIHRLRMFRRYVFFGFPRLEAFVAKREEVMESRSQAHRDNEKDKVSYYQGQMDIIDSILEEFMEIKNENI